MTPRRILLVSALTLLFAVSAIPEARGGGGPYRPDAWIKLCGLSLGCAIDPPPHRWLGKNVYNTTGRRQTINVDINEGEGVRFWITVENDGTESDTLAVQGCRGNRTYEVNSVLIGQHTGPDAGATNVTRQFRRGTLTFDLAPGEDVVFTLNIITHFNKGVVYLCPSAIHSVLQPAAEDTVVAEMVTY